jgi:hypothetical protein
MAESETKTAQASQRRILPFIGGFIIVVFLFLGGAMFWTQQRGITSQAVPTPTVAQSQGKIAADIFRYQGKEGIDALTLLKQLTKVEQDSSGLVTSINNRKADTSKKEYWSFFVNNKMAEVGPADYVTKDTDQIEWKIQTY